jgi:glucan phosphorylase
MTLDRFANDVGFLEKYSDIKRANKQKLSQLILQRTGIPLTRPLSLMFRSSIHEYKRQLLAILKPLHSTIPFARIQDRLLFRGSKFLPARPRRVTGKPKPSSA